MAISGYAAFGTWLLASLFSPGKFLNDGQTGCEPIMCLFSLETSN